MKLKFKSSVAYHPDDALGTGGRRTIEAERAPGWLDFCYNSAGQPA